MCGLTGFVDSSRQMGPGQLEATVGRMANTLKSRGPDDWGCWIDANQGVALGHRRLSVIDLSQAGHQPMVSQSGRLVMAYNGEIYSFKEMRKTLAAAGVSFRGNSDSEVIVEAFDRWGLEKTLQQMVGMFAIALWNTESGELQLIRDRIGIKPLYWGLVAGRLIFASELKALNAYPNWQPHLNRDALAAYLRHCYVPGPLSVYQNVQKLPPGSYLTYRPGGNPEQTTYWDFRTLAGDWARNRPQLSQAEAEQSLHAVLRDAVKCRMVADVPLGALLSGGIDSSMVTALMQDQSDRPIRTFSIGFKEDQFNEAPYAAAVAAHLGTDHTELYIEPDHALDVIPLLPGIYDEPFADSSQIPTYLVCELTKQHVTVALSGDGGDELFTGYNRYLYAQSIYRRISRIPLSLRSLLGGAIRATPQNLLDTLALVVPEKSRPNQFGHKAHKVADAIAKSDPDALYRQLVSYWDDPEQVVRSSREPHGVLWQDEYRSTIEDFTERMQFFDTLTYLPDDILTKVDRASMAVSLEARVPLLDHRVVEFAWRLPMHLKLAGGQGKVLLRRVLQRYLPNHLIERPKMGFGVPLDAWLRGPLRDWGESLLSESRLRQQGLLDPAPIRAKWRAHLRGKNWAYDLWNVLVLQAWLDERPWRS